MGPQARGICQIHRAHPQSRITARLLTLAVTAYQASATAAASTGLVRAASSSPSPWDHSAAASPRGTKHLLGFGKPWLGGLEAPARWYPRLRTSCDQSPVPHALVLRTARFAYRDFMVKPETAFVISIFTPAAMTSI